MIPSWDTNSNEHDSLLSPREQEERVALEAQRVWLSSFQQDQMARLEQRLDEYRSQLTISQQKGWGDAALLAKQILTVQAHLEQLHQPPTKFSQAAETMARSEGDYAEHTQRLHQAHQTQIARLQVSLDAKEAALAVSQEWSLADQQILTKQITDLKYALSLLEN